MNNLSESRKSSTRIRVTGCHMKNKKSILVGFTHLHQRQYRRHHDRGLYRCFQTQLHYLMNRMLRVHSNNQTTNELSDEGRVDWHHRPE